MAREISSLQEVGMNDVPQVQEWNELEGGIATYLEVLSSYDGS